MIGFLASCIAIAAKAYIGGIIIGLIFSLTSIIIGAISR